MTHSTRRILWITLFTAAALMALQHNAHAAPAGGGLEFRSTFDQAVEIVQSFGLPMITVAAMMFFAALGLGYAGQASKTVITILFSGAGFFGTPAIVARFWGSGVTF